MGRTVCHREEMSQIWARSRFHALLLNHGPPEGLHRSEDTSRGAWGTSPALGLAVTDPRRRWWVRGFRLHAHLERHHHSIAWTGLPPGSPGTGRVPAHRPDHAASSLTTGLFSLWAFQVHLCDLRTQDRPWYTADAL